MAQRNATVRTLTEDVYVEHQGGRVYPRTNFDTGEVEQRDGSDVFAVSDAKVTVNGQVYEGGTLLTLSKLEDDIPAGTVLVPDGGSVEVSFRVEVKEGKDLPGGGRSQSRGWLIPTVYCERLTPLKTVNVADLIAKARAAEMAQAKKAPAPAGGGETR